MKFICLIAIQLCLAGCAAPMALSLAKDNNVLVNDATKGEVVFFRPCKLLGAARGVYVLQDKEKIGGLNCSNFFVYRVDPGTYHFAAEDYLRSEKYLTVEVEADKRYYIKADLGWGVIDAVPYLELSSEAEAEPAMQSSTRVTLRQ